MSQLEVLRDEIDQFARQTKETAGLLEEYQGVFDRGADEVETLIGGTSQAGLRNVLASIDDAKRKIDAAVAALHAAAEEARRFGDSL